GWRRRHSLFRVDQYRRQQPGAGLHEDIGCRWPHVGADPAGEPCQRQRRQAYANPFEKPAARRLAGDRWRAVTGGFKERGAGKMKIRFWKKIKYRHLLMFWALVWLTAWPTFGRPQNGPQGAKNRAPAVGAAAINFELKSLDGKAVSLETFRGKPLVINFFASWCDPCREEMPLLNQLASKSNQDGYAILGIAVEDTRAA